MIRLARQAAALGRDLLWMGGATGQWWLLAVMLILMIAAVLGPTVKVVVTPTLYVLF